MTGVEKVEQPKRQIFGKLTGSITEKGRVEKQRMNCSQQSKVQMFKQMRIMQKLIIG